MKTAIASVVLLCTVATLVACSRTPSEASRTRAEADESRGLARDLSDTAPAALSADQAAALATLMCRQLRNVATILPIAKLEPSSDTPAPPPQEPFVSDDVYDALVRLGPYSLPCLTEALTDTRWMPDPRMEPLLGAPLVGDVAYMILMDKGVSDVLPALAHKNPNEVGMDDYFLWPKIGNHRQRLQGAVRTWIAAHADCCGMPPTMRKTAPSRMKFQMSAAELEKTRKQFARFRPGMTPAAVLRILGKPDAIDTKSDPEHFQINLLGDCASNRNENMAYIYFAERWTDEIGRRDPFRDRYAIVYFSAEGKLTRVFSNVAAIPPVFPGNEALWLELMWGKVTKE